MALKLITVDDDLFNLDGSRHRILGAIVRLSDRPSPLPSDVELIPWEEFYRQQDEARAKFVGPPRPIRFTHETMTW